MSSPIVGAWQLIDDEHDPDFVERDAMLLFTDKHVSMVSTPKDRVKTAEPEQSGEQALKTLSEVAALAGTYEITGNRVTITRVVNLHPHHIGMSTELIFTVDGDRMIWSLQEGAAGGKVSSSTWQKIS